jgi:hypothetical protein
MKKALFGLLIFSLVASAFTLYDKSQKKVLRHVVIFSFKSTSTAANIKMIEDAFSALPGKINEIKDFEWGTNNSPENLAQGFTHCFFVSFGSEKDREIYLPHPDHKAFVAAAGPHIDKVLVLDYWVQK